MKKRPTQGFRSRGPGDTFGARTDEISESLLRQARKSGQLNLSGRGLTRIPDKVWRLNQELPSEAKSVSLDNTDERWWEQVDLEKLILASNCLTEISENICHLPALTVLDIHDNSLSSLPDEVGELSNLRKVNLSHNKLERLPVTFGNLKSLCILRLEHNNLLKLGEELGQLFMLEELDLSHNKLSSLPSNLCLCKSLRTLNLTHNALESLPQEIELVKELRDLNISHNKLTHLPKGLGQLQCLVRLDCRYNQLYSIPELTSCSSLKELYLGNNKLPELRANELKFIPSVAVLDLRDNQISSVPDEITILKGLERLDLTNNNVSGLPYVMGTMEGLKAVSLEGNPLKSIRRDILMRGTQAVLKHLKSRMPDLPTDNVSSVVDVPDAPLSSVLPATTGSTVAGLDVQTLRNMKTLNYNDKKVSSIPDDVWDAATSAEVTIVNLSKNLLAQLPNRLFALSNCLTELNLGFNKLTQLPSEIGTLSKLKLLDLRNNQISELPESMSSLISLRDITLSLNRFSEIPPVLYSLDKLEVLLASDNRISSIDVSGLLRLSNLATLDLQNNNIAQVPPELGNVSWLRSLQLGGNAFRNPRPAVLAKGTPSLLAYLRDRIPT